MFDNDNDPPLEEVDEDVGPRSSVTVALFVVSAQAINPVNVNVYDVDASNNETLVETLTVDGSLLVGDLVTPPGAPFDVNLQEIHDPIVRPGRITKFLGKQPGQTVAEDDR